MLVALVAAVTIGPAYYSAAQSSILQDTVNQAQVTGRGFELSQSGPVAAVDSVTVEARTTLAAHLGGPAAASRIFGRPVTAAETTVQAQHQTVPLVYRSGACGQLHFTAGRCPAGADQVAVSSSLAFLFHWHVGQRIAVPTWHQLTITGMYRITAAEGGASYWFDAGGRYFPYENIEITLFAAGMPAGQAAAAARAALAAVGLAEHAGQLADELSGGQQQRVAVARALASQPTVLLADEPTADQDSKSRELVLDRMLRIGVAGGALVLATHDPEVAQRCDRVLDLSQLRTEPVSDPGLAPR